MKIPDFKSLVAVDLNSIRREINAVQKIDFWPTEKYQKLILQSIDLTSLEGSDTTRKIKLLCQKAISKNNLPDVAAVCVYPVFVKIARKELTGTKIKVASVSGGFPSGQIPLKLKLREVKYAIEEGADEIDMVISRGTFLEEKYNKVFDEIAAIRNVCKNITLKVILETGELNSLENVKKAGDIALYAGADFIKTSTGKISVNATLESVCVMLHSIKEFSSKTGKQAGIKPSGGISDFNTACQYLQLTGSILGEDRLNPLKFRFGASRLYDAVLAETTKKSNSSDKGTGNY